METVGSRPSPLQLRALGGGGYPDGLAGEAIPLGLRIIAISAALAAIKARRPHRAGRSPDEALAELRRCAGAQYDPRVVAALAQDLTAEPGPAPAPTPARV